MELFAYILSGLKFVLWDKPRELVAYRYEQSRDYAVTAKKTGDFKDQLKILGISLATKHHNIYVVKYALGTRMYSFPLLKLHDQRVLLSVEWHKANDVIEDITHDIRPLLGPNEDFYQLPLTIQQVMPELDHGFVRFNYLHYMVDVKVNEIVNLNNVSDKSEQYAHEHPNEIPPELMYDSESGSEPSVNYPTVDPPSDDDDDEHISVTTSESESEDEPIIHPLL